MLKFSWTSTYKHVSFFNNTCTTKLIFYCWRQLWLHFSAPCFHLTILEKSSTFKHLVVLIVQRNFYKCHQWHFLIVTLSKQIFPSLYVLLKVYVNVFVGYYNIYLSTNTCQSCGVVSDLKDIFLIMIYKNKEHFILLFYKISAYTFLRLVPIKLDDYKVYFQILCFYSGMKYEKNAVLKILSPL